MYWIKILYYDGEIYERPEPQFSLAVYTAKINLNRDGRAVVESGYGGPILYEAFRFNDQIQETINWHYGYQDKGGSIYLFDERKDSLV